MLSQIKYFETRAAKKSYKLLARQKTAFKKAATLALEVELEGSDLTLSVIFMSDDELLHMNRSVLEHDYYTDILTFEIERKGKSLEAELYVSVDRARDHATRYRTPVDRELIRLIVHGILHLAGYKDKTAQQKKRMRTRERFFLSKLFPL